MIALWIVGYLAAGFVVAVLLARWSDGIGLLDWEMGDRFAAFGVVLLWPVVVNIAAIAGMVWCVGRAVELVARRWP